MAEQINLIMISAQGSKDFTRFNLACGNCVEYWRLTMSVDIINLKTLLLKKLNQFGFAISSCVEHWRLLETVFLKNIDTRLNKFNNKFEGLIFFGNHRCREYEILREMNWL